MNAPVPVSPLKLKDAGLLRQAMLVDGAWVQADSGETLEVRNSSTGAVVARVRDGGAAEPRQFMLGRAIDGSTCCESGFWPKTG